MNTKELVQKINEAQTPVGELFALLAADGEALVKARRAQSPEAIRSCYLEQNTKWVSACNKTPGLDPAQFMEFMSQHPKYRHVIKEHVKPVSRYESTLSALAAHRKQMEKFNSQISEAAGGFVRQITKWVEQLKEDPETANLSEQECVEFSANLLLRQTLCDVVKTQAKDLKDVREILNQTVLMYDAVRKLQPLCPDIQREDLIKYLMKQPEIMLRMGGLV